MRGRFMWRGPLFGAARDTVPPGTDAHSAYTTRVQCLVLMTGRRREIDVRRVLPFGPRARFHQDQGGLVSARGSTVLACVDAMRRSAGAVLQEGIQLDSKADPLALIYCTCRTQFYVFLLIGILY